MKFDAVPADYEEEAARRNMNARMLSSSSTAPRPCRDGGLANATGLAPTPMHGPDAVVSTIAHVAGEDGGILSKSGVVTTLIGKGAASSRSPRLHERIHERLGDLEDGPGPYFTFHRPYHLTPGSPAHGG